MYKRKSLIIILSVIALCAIAAFFYHSTAKPSWLRKSEPVDPSVSSASGQYNTYKHLKVPTCVAKIDKTYFISDCYHNQIIYSDSLETPLTEWKIMADNINLGHTLASDGIVYLADDTDNHSILVYEKKEEKFLLTQKFSSIGIRPHYVVYDDSTSRFYALSSMTGEIYVFKRLENSTEVVLEEIRSMEELSESYIRSFTIMDDEIYFVSGPNAIVRARLSDLTFLEEYPVGPELSGMVQLEKIQDWYYITISTDIDGNQDAATIIRTQDLHGLIDGDYEDIYSLFGEGGTPYYMTTFDGHWYLTEHRKKKRGLWQFDVIDNEIVNIKLLY
ncbi:MAG: hypothetical protein Q4F83_13735 [Eubacteriales bacterium]|nr:hypothetical protein [Eubacteriales bacterium]